MSFMWIGIVSKAVKRLVHLPLSGTLLRYTGNKAHHFMLKAKGDLAVAYPSTVKGKETSTGDVIIYLNQ